jgi:hypothetical protein
VTTIMTLVQRGIFATRGQAADISYLADTVVLLRYFEMAGAVRQAVSVVKKRSGNHERTIRVPRGAGGLTVGGPLRDFQGCSRRAQLPRMSNDLMPRVRRSTRPARTRGRLMATSRPAELHAAAPRRDRWTTVAVLAPPAATAR